MGITSQPSPLLTEVNLKAHCILSKRRNSKRIVQETPPKIDTNRFKKKKKGGLRSNETTPSESGDDSATMTESTSMEFMGLTPVTDLRERVASVEFECNNHQIDMESKKSKSLPTTAFDEYSSCSSYDANEVVECR